MINQVYENIKTGNRYLVLLIGKHSETLEEMVAYRRIGVSDKTIWVRPLKLFVQKFNLSDDQGVYDVR